MAYNARTHTALAPHQQQHRMHTPRARTAPATAPHAHTAHSYRIGQTSHAHTAHTRRSPYMAITHATDHTHHKQGLAYLLKIDLKKDVYIHRINYLSTGAGFLPTAVLSMALVHNNLPWCYSSYCR